MSRNGSGVYSLPVPPFTPGTVILSADVNSDFSDIATALTGSIAADGQTPITGQLRGSQASAPAYSITGDINTGFGSSSADTAYIQCGGVNILACTTLGATITGTAAITGTLSVTGDTTFGNIATPLTVYSSNAGATAGPILDLYRDSATPAASDAIGAVDYNGRDSAANKQLYARLLTVIDDTTSGSEDAHWGVQTVVAGTLTTVLFSSGADISIPGALVVSGDVTGAQINGTSVGGTFVATQAEQESGGAVDRIVTPGRQQFHPSAAKMWGQVLNPSGTPTLQAGSYNITSITDTAVGRLTVTIATDFSNALWSCVPAIGTGNGPAITNNYSVHVNQNNLAAGSCELDCTSSSNAQADPDAWYFVGFGDQ